MLSTRSFGRECPSRPSSTVNFATNTLLVLALAVLVCCAAPSHAQASLALGTVGLSPEVVQCPTSNGWYYYSSGGANTYMNCHFASVSCPNTADLGLTYAYLNPAAMSPPLVSQAKGVVVLHGGSGGTTPESFALTDAYFKAGYEIVQIAWDDDWEMTQDPFSTITANIQNAACRPATFFNWVFTNLFPSVYSANQQAGMCALGDSAGSAAVAYSLAYYGAGAWFDNVELLSGPVLSDIKQGCGVGPNLGANNPVTVCGQTNYQGGQYGCQLGTSGSTWTLGPEYLPGAISAVAKWTNDNSCANTYPTNTSGSSNAAWLAQSIVDQSSGGAGQGAVATFNYPNTAMSGWLCRSVVSNPNYNCAANGNANSNYCPNNSSPQGQIFYANIGSNNSPPHYAVYAVDNCSNAEAVGSGNVPGYLPQIFNGTVQGLTAITDDMVGSGTIIPAQCVYRHQQ